MQLGLLDRPSDTRRIGFVAVTWDGQRVALMLSQLPAEQSENPQQGLIQMYRLEIKSTSKDWIDSLRRHHMESFLNSISSAKLFQA